MFRKKFSQILKTLGFVDKAKKNELTEEDWVKIDAAFQEKFGTTLSDAMAENEAAASNQADREAALAIINSATGSTSEEEDPEAEEDDPENSPKRETNTSLEDGVRTMATQLNNLSNHNRELRTQVERMAGLAAPDRSTETVTRNLRPQGPGHTDTHLFGVEHPMFDMSTRWNKIAKNPNYAKTNPVKEKRDLSAFQDATYKYGASVAERYRYLKENKLLDNLKDSSGTFTNNLDDLSNAGLGDQYVTLRQDALIARIIAIPSPYDLFPRRYGVQDRELMTIAYFDELSQGYQRGHVFKGGMKLEPEMAYVDDSMFKSEFGPMKEIERMYIGYLNSDGSDPMKWSMFEWQLLNMYTKLTQEQHTRVIRGCFVEPEKGKPGSYLNAGTGLIYTLQRYYHENKLLPHSDSSYNDYTEATMVSAVLEFVKDVQLDLDEDETFENKFLYLNKLYKSWWLTGIRAKYGKDIDFTGPESYANVVPDYALKIKWVPSLGTSKLMFIQEHGNLQAIENVPGEMLAVDFDREMELMHVWSTWKEGFSGFIVGRQFSSLEELKENKYVSQAIYMNRPAFELESDATTADATKNYWFVTASNSDATTLTDISNAKKGVVYIIETKGEANPTKIAKTDKFAAITEAWTPVKEGDYIMVVLNSEGAFRELERRVNGVRKINVEVQPNIIGGRK